MDAGRPYGRAGRRKAKSLIMESVNPVVPGFEKFEVVFAKNQPEYNQLAVLPVENGVMSRWRLTDAERQHIAEGGDLFILCLHFNGPLQPILPLADTAENAMKTLVELTAPL